MRKRAFTLVEIVVVIVIIAILVTVGIPVYQVAVEDSKAKVCQANLEALSLAVDTYVMQNDAVPASLSHLDPQDIKNAYVEILHGRGGWRIKLALFILDVHRANSAYAQGVAVVSFKDAIAKGDINLITCPMDNTPPGDGGISYGINQSILGLTAVQYRNVDGNIVIIADNDTLTFSDLSGLAERHKLGGERRALAVQKNKEVWQVNSGNKKISCGVKK